MPRNPSKRPCQVPGCRNWAMRAHTHCRPHRDFELGPRGAGAPPGNLNALRTGQHAHPLSPDQLDQLVTAILSTPDQLPHCLEPVIRSIHRRCQDPVKTLAALQAILPDLLSNVADRLFAAELYALLELLPPARRNQVKHSILRLTLPFGPIHRLEILRGLQRRLQAKAELSSVVSPELLPHHLADTPTPPLQAPVSGDFSATPTPEDIKVDD